MVFPGERKIDLGVFLGFFEIWRGEIGRGKSLGCGGKVLGEPMEIPGIGQYVSFFDTESNRVSMLQPATRMAEARFGQSKLQLK
jgi:hypothetical protein